MNAHVPTNLPGKQSGPGAAEALHRPESRPRPFPHCHHQRRLLFFGVSSPLFLNFAHAESYRIFFQACSLDTLLLRGSPMWILVAAGVSFHQCVTFHFIILPQFIKLNVLGNELFSSVLLLRSVLLRTLLNSCTCLLLRLHKSFSIVHTAGAESLRRGIQTYLRDVRGPGSRPRGRASRRLFAGGRFVPSICLRHICKAR